jgi:hypothetical protein
MKIKDVKEKLNGVWYQTMQDITTISNKDATLLDIFYDNLVAQFKYKEIAEILNVAVQSVYNYNQLKEKSKEYNNNVRKQLALLFIELLEMQNVVKD